MAISHPFQCSYCPSSFTTKTGLGVHKKRKHASETNEEVKTERVKARWTSEELALMAYKEAELFAAAPASFPPVRLSGRNLDKRPDSQDPEMISTFSGSKTLSDIFEVEEPVSSLPSVRRSKRQLRSGTKMSPPIVSPVLTCSDSNDESSADLISSDSFLIDPSGSEMPDLSPTDR
ncbi:hypothetical protein AVEN_120843-1 [Araneus ventricosus]|uniref:C2H2-type domain-containing protein n=1 Tax=Araneus ventricosus TaxID=182803 RepID=A0A4Y2Q3P1_ARAVE|nr:hypothetical protein AVEN_120843-1 [Araneus ventricosus]